MSAASDMLSEGFLALLETSGETLTLRRTPTITVTGVVDRSLERAKRKQEVNFDPERASMIAVKSAASTPAAQVGETFTDAHGRRHRIATVLPTDGLVERFRCDVT